MRRQEGDEGRCRGERAQRCLEVDNIDCQQGLVLRIALHWGEEETLKLRTNNNTERKIKVETTWKRVIH